MTGKLGYGKEAQIKPGYLSIARKGRSMRSSLWGVLGSQGDLKALDAMGTKTPKSSAAMGEYGGTDTNISHSLFHLNPVLTHQLGLYPLPMISSH